MVPFSGSSCILLKSSSWPQVQPEIKSLAVLFGHFSHLNALTMSDHWAYHPAKGDSYSIDMLFHFRRSKTSGEVNELIVV